MAFHVFCQIAAEQPLGAWDDSFYMQLSEYLLAKEHIPNFKVCPAEQQPDNSLSSAVSVVPETI